MPLITSNANFDDIFVQKKPSEELLSAIVSYLRKLQIPRAKRLAEWIDSGKELDAFACREDMVFPLAQQMDEEDIPYAVIMTNEQKSGFICIPEDRNAVRNAIQEILAQKGRLCKVVTGEQMIEMVADPKRKDKTVLAISGLSPLETYIIKKKTAEYIDGATLGIDSRSGGGNYSVYIDAQNGIKRSYKEGVDMRRIFLESMLAANGPNGIANKNLNIMEERISKQIAINFRDISKDLRQTPVYLMGRGNQYIKINHLGFEYGRYILGKNGMTPDKLYEASELQPDYRQLLASFANRIPEREYATDEKTFLAAMERQLHSGEDRMRSVHKLSVARRVAAMREKELAAAIDVVVSRRLQNSQIMDMSGHWEEKFSDYMDYAGGIIKALSRGMEPKGYDHNEIQSIKEVLNKYQINASSYEQVSDRIKNVLQIDSLERDVEKVADINARLEKLEARAQMERAEREEEKQSRGRGRSSGSRGGDD